jgi:crossover junction endodeoxyribonuclease RuvC
VTTVIGLDLSLTNTGIARIAWNGTEVVADIHRVQSAGKNTDTWTMRSMRFDKLKHAIVMHVEPSSSVDLIVLEGPSFNSKSPSSHDRSWFWGTVFDYFTFAWDMQVLVVPPASAKKWATNNGNADKDDMMLAAARMWPALDGIKNDTADALALAGMGMQLLDGPCPFPLYAYRTAVVDKIRAELAAVA